MKNLFSLSILLFSVCILSAQGNGHLGLWKTIDDETKEAKSYVEMYEKGGKLYGKITRLLLMPADMVCDKCKGDKYNKPVVGMVIIDGLSREEGVWSGASILDPKTGKFYDCTLWVSEDNKDQLRVKGKHWSGLSRTQTWYRISE